MKKKAGTQKGGISGSAHRGESRAGRLARRDAVPGPRAIKQADPEVVEEGGSRRKPSNPGVPVWSHHGMICTGETYKSVVKLTFAKAHH